MPDDLLVRIGADPSDLKKGLGEAKREVKGFAGEVDDVANDISKSWKDMATSAATAFGAHEIFDFLKDCVNEASAAEEATVKLTAALRAQGVTSKRVADDIVDFSAALQSNTRYNDEAITDVQRMLISLGQLSGQGLKDATRATLDLAAGLGIDLSTAAMLVGKAANGSTGALSRHGIVVKETHDVTKDFASALEQINQKFGGSAQGQIEGYAGVTAQLANTFSDLKEAAGGALLPSLTDAATGIREVINAANTDTTGLTRLTVALLSLGNSEALRAFNEMKKDGGLLGDETALSQSEAHLQGISDHLVEIGAAIKQAKADQEGAGPIDQARLELEIATLEKKREVLKSMLPAALEAVTAAEGNAVATRVLTQEELDALEKKRKKWLEYWEARLNAGADLTQQDLDATGRDASMAKTEEYLQAQQEVREIEAKNNAERMAELEAQLQATSDLTQMELDEAAHKRLLQQQKERQLALQETQAIYSAVGNAAVNALEDVALNSEDAGEAAEQALRAVARQLIQIAIARIIANAGVAGSNVAARDTATSGAAGVVTGLAAAAAIAALAGKIPSLHDGGKLGGSPGRDPTLFRGERGERVLSREETADYESGRGGGQVIHFNFSSVLPPDEAGLREVLRTTIVPQLNQLARQRMI